MNKKSFIKLWIIVQVSLFILPILISLSLVPLEISLDEFYVTTDDKPLWKLEYEEVYYFIAIGWGLLMGIPLQLFNFMWAIYYQDL